MAFSSLFYNTTTTTTTTTAIIHLDDSIVVKMFGSGVVIANKKDFPPSEAMFSNEFTETFQLVVGFGLMLVLCIFGILSNTVVIIVFYKQGYKETINISLTAIAVWDLVNCGLGIAYRTVYIVRAFAPQAFSITYATFIEVVFELPHYFVFNASYVLAAYVAVERCLCVSMPFKVKSLLTPKVVTCIVVVLSTISVLTKIVLIPIAQKIKWLHHPRVNRTVAVLTSGLVTLDNRPFMVYFRMTGIGFSSFSMLIQTVCFLVILYHLRKGSKFRSATASSSATAASKSPVTAKVSAAANVHEHEDNRQVKSTMDQRDRQVTKMLLVVIFVYIVTFFLPSNVVDVANILYPEFMWYNTYHNAFTIMYATSATLSLFNIAGSCIIYYSMSSKFKDAFRQLFNLTDKRNN